MSKRLPYVLVLCLLFEVSLGQEAKPAQGRVSGVVISLADGTFLKDATIKVLPDGPEARTDMDGMFDLKVPAGSYQLKITHPDYLDQSVEGVRVQAGQTTFQDVGLNLVGMDLGQVTVVAHADAVSEVVLLAARKTALTLQDAISAQEMSKSTGGSAADAMQRVTGVTVVEDKYVYVRGLGERYSNTMLNGSILPSTQPDKKVISMDMFPTALLKNIQTEKSYTPDQPAEFSGGLVKIETTDFPREATLKLSYSGGFGTNTTFKDFLTYPGGGRDWLGYDDGTRALPEIIPDQRVVTANRFTAGFTPQEVERFGEAFSNVWSPQSESAIPDQSFSVVAGNSFGKLGLIMALAHSNKFHSQQEKQSVYRVGGGSTITPFHEYEFDVSARSIRTGAVANLAYELTENNRIQLRNFYTHDSSDETRIFEGFNGDARNLIRDLRLRFVEESLLSSQVSGEHYLPVLGNSLLEWKLNFSTSSLEEPDLRESIYEFNDNRGVFVLADESQSGFRMFNDLNEHLWEPALDWTIFLVKGAMTGSLKVGGGYRTRNRDFASRRFRFIPRNPGGIDITGPPEEIFTPENIRPDGFELREETRPTDRYEADEITRSGYGMVNLHWRQWQFHGGVRVEGNVQNVATFDPFNRDSPQAVSARLGKTDVLPAAGVLYQLRQDMNLRGSFSETLNRPEFRELSEFEFTDVVGGRAVVGNPELVRALIRNYDVRWEWFLSADEIVSGSFFFKDFENPIERVVQPTAQLRTSFRNAQSARNFGFELEVRKNLGILSSRLSDFRVGANYTLVDSEVEIGEQDLVVLTSLSRPLVGQSKHSVNTTFEYTHPETGITARLLFNYQGARLTDVGSLGLPDIQQEGYPSLDALFLHPLGNNTPWSFKFSSENLLNREHKSTQGGQPFRVYKSGRSFSVGISYSFYGG